MPKEIKTTIAVDGEAAFKRAINDATTSLRNMGTQLTLAQAEFKKDGDAMKLMETRSKALKGEIGQQEEIVKALEKAVSDSAKAYGENSDKTEKWQAELNRAKAKLANLQNELTLNEQGLDRNGKAFDDSSQKAADYQATLQTIGKNVSFQTISEGIKGVTGTIEGAIKKVFNFAKAIRETFADAGEWADQLMTDSIKYRMDPEELQRWQYAAKIIDTDVETIYSAQDKLSKKVKNGWKNGDLDMWKMLGIDLTDSTGNQREALDIMFDLGETLMSMSKIDGNDIRADAYAMEVFGKSWRELLPLFTAGRAAWEAAKQDAEVVSNERVANLTALDDANQALENSWDVAKYSFLAELAPTVTEVTEAVTEMLHAFNEWMDTDEGKKAMNDLSEAIKELFSGLKDVKFKDAIDTVQKAIEGIKTALSWLDEHKNDVVTALEIIAGGFALLKVADLAINIGKIVSGFQTLWAGAKNPLPTVPGTGGTGTSTPTTSPTTGTDTVIGSGAAGGAGVALGNMVTGAAAKASAFITANSGLLGAAGDMFLNQTNAGRAVRDGTNVIEGLTQDVNEKVDEIKHNAETFGDDWKDVWENNPVINWFRNLGKTNKEANDWVLGDDVTAEDAAEFVRSNGDKDWRPSYMRGIEPAIPEIEENIDLDEVYTPEQIADAIQDWWDARQNANNGTEPWSEEEAAYRWMEEVLGDKFTDFWDTFVEKTEGMDTSDMEDIPADWYSNLSADLSDAVAQMKVNTEASRASSDKIASADFKRFNGLPVEIQRAAQAGTAAGVSGIKVYMDGSAVGRLVAPYVSAIIANAVG